MQKNLFHSLGALSGYFPIFRVSFITIFFTRALHASTFSLAPLTSAILAPPKPVPQSCSKPKQLANSLKLPLQCL